MAEYVTLEKIHPQYLTHRTRRKLSKCTFRESGVLADVIEEPDIASYGRNDCVYILEDSQGKLIGWGMKYHREFMLYIYTKHRRKGWGSILYNEARKDFGKRKPKIYADHAVPAYRFWKHHGLCK